MADELTVIRDKLTRVGSYTSFLELGRRGVYPWSFGQQRAGTAGLRNRLAHECETVNDTIVYHHAHTIPSLYRRDIACVLHELKQRRPKTRKKP